MKLFVRDYKKRELENATEIYDFNYISIFGEKWNCNISIKISLEEFIKNNFYENRRFEFWLLNDQDKTVSYFVTENLEEILYEKNNKVKITLEVIDKMNAE